MSHKTHALLSPSSAHRWLVCPPIARLEELEKIKEKRSVYTTEGDIAHQYAEIKLKLYTSKIYIDDYYKKLRKLKPKLNEEIRFYIDNYVWEVYRFIRSLNKPKVFIEKKVNLSSWVPGGYGYADIIVHAENNLYVIDLKYGRGIKVSSYNNPQMLLYALGAYESVLTKKQKENLKEIHLVIAQVRLNNYSKCFIPKDELLYWANNYLYPRAHQANAGVGEWTITEDTLRFSSIGAKLTKRAQNNFKVIEPTKLKDPTLLNTNQLIKIFEASKEIKKWLNDIEKYLLNLKVQEDIPGVKLVHSKTLRKIKNQKEVIKILKENKYTDIFELKSITKLEKQVGKQKLNELIGQHFTQSAPKVTLAPVSDKRLDISEFLKEIGE